MKPQPPEFEKDNASPMAQRFRGFLPVVVDVETGGFNSARDALLEVAAVTLTMDSDGLVRPDETLAFHIEPFDGANIEQSALDFTGIDLDDPKREPLPEKEALRRICTPVRKAVKATGCQRAVLVGHNPAFDLGFYNAAVERTDFRRSPFHPFSSFDTATLGGLAFGQTVLSRAAQAAGLDWDSSQAHSARYDAIKTAELFCAVVNRWKILTGM